MEFLGLDVEEILRSRDEKQARSPIFYAKTKVGNAPWVSVTSGSSSSISVSSPTAIDSENLMRLLRRSFSSITLHLGRRKGHLSSLQPRKAPGPSDLKLYSLPSARNLTVVRCRLEMQQIAHGNPNNEASSIPQYQTRAPARDVSLADICSDLHARLQTFLDSAPETEELRNLQNQVRTALAVSEKALDQYRYDESQSKIAQLFWAIRGNMS